MKFELRALTTSCKVPVYYTVFKYLGSVTIRMAMCVTLKAVRQSVMHTSGTQYAAQIGKFSEALGRKLFKRISGVFTGQFMLPASLPLASCPFFPMMLLQLNVSSSHPTLYIKRKTLMLQAMRSRDSSTPSADRSSRRCSWARCKLWHLEVHMFPTGYELNRRKFVYLDTTWRVHRSSCHC